MKYPFFLLLCLWAAQTTFAQAQPDSTATAAPVTNPRVEHLIQKQTAALGLTNAQVEELRPLYNKQFELQGKLAAMQTGTEVYLSAYADLQDIRYRIENIYTADQKNKRDELRLQHIQASHSKGGANKPNPRGKSTVLTPDGK